MENHFAVPAWKMFTNGKRFRAGTSEPIREKIKTKPKPKMKGPTAGVSGGLPREPTDETDNVFERKKALKRNVATRQPARDVGQVL